MAVSNRFSLLAMMAVRNFPLFVIAAFIPFSRSLFHFSQSLLSLFNDSSHPLLCRCARVLLVVLLIWQAIIITAKHPLNSAVPRSSDGAVHYFSSHHLQGPIFNNFDIGSDLEYRLYPQEKTFVDGRPEAYPASFFKEVYIPMQQDPALFTKLSQKYHFQTIMVSHTDQTPWAESFLTSITKDPSWKVTYLDETMLVIEPASNSTHQIVDNPRIITPYTSSLASLLQLAHFYSIVGWTKSLEATLQAILIHDQHNCPALYNLAVLMEQQKNPTVTLYTNEYQMYCH